MRLLCALHDLGLLDQGIQDIDPRGLLIAGFIATVAIIVVAIFLIADEAVQAAPVSSRSTHAGTTVLAGPWMASSNIECPSEGSKLSSMEGVPLARAIETKPAAG